MKSFKKFLILVLVVLTFSCLSVACGDNKDKGNKSTNNATSNVNHEAEIIQVKGATINGTNITFVVNNQTNLVDFCDKITTSYGADWKMYYDNAGQIEIPTKIATGTSGTLKNGDNVFYIVVTSLNGKMSTTYTLKVHKSYLVDITYYYNGQIISSDQAYTGFTYTTSYKQQMEGLYFAGWYQNAVLLSKDYYYTFTLWEETNLSASWIDAPSTSYKVEYYLQNLEDANYTLQADLTKNLQGISGEIVTAEIIEILHFTPVDFNVVGVVKADGSTVLKVYYTRNYYYVNVSAQNNSRLTVIGGGVFTNAQAVSLTANVTALGYMFDGWYNGDVLVSSLTNYTFNPTNHLNLVAKAKPITTTPYRVEYYFQNVSGGGYSIDNSLTQNLTGTTDTTIYAEIKDIEHFTAEKAQVCDTLNGDGSTILKVYYTRNSYTITVNSQEPTLGPVSGGGKYLFGENITITATFSSSIVFIGWYSNGVLISFNPSYTFIVNQNMDITAYFSLVIFKCSGNTITGLTEYGKTLTEITIPEIINGVKITKIGSGAFYNCTNLTSIEIPSNVTNIGDYAFNGCSGLTSIEIPSNVTSIGSYAFYGCTSLTSVNLINTSGWYISTNSSATSGTSISSTNLEDVSTAATYLKSTYYNYYWKRS